MNLPIRNAEEPNFSKLGVISLALYFFLLFPFSIFIFQRRVLMQVSQVGSTRLIILNKMDKPRIKDTIDA